MHSSNFIKRSLILSAFNIGHPLADALERVGVIFVENFLEIPIGIHHLYFVLGADVLIAAVKQLAGADNLELGLQGSSVEHDDVHILGPKDVTNFRIQP